MGPPPWQVINEALSAASFPYEVSSPDGVGLLDNYEIMLNDKIDGHSIKLIDLSSGEKVILQLILWIFAASKQNVFPKILLLDEPDAHLHPAMTTQFIDVIQEVLVKKYGIRVIMTTHSPSTVALAPEGSVFEMKRGNSRIFPVASRSYIIEILTAGLITVSRASKFCFVEDEDDVSFYQGVFEIVSDSGPSRDPKALEVTPSIVFIPASVGKGHLKIPGGIGNTEKWVDKLDAEPLSSMFFGIIDRDLGNISHGRIRAIGRYSFENYLLDPVNIYALMLEEGAAPSVSGLQINQGDEHLLREFDSVGIQSISSCICEQVEKRAPTLISSYSSTVKYTRGQHITVPDWVVNHRGHDLMILYQQLFGGPKTVNKKRLEKIMRRTRLIPVELAGVLRDIQS